MKPGKCWIKEHPTASYAFVLSCPGREEMALGLPAAGATGRNLDRLINILTGWDVPFCSRMEALITNAWPGVEYEGHGRTEAEFDEILLPWNLNRLESELKTVSEWIICFGDRALRAVSELERTGRLPEGCRYAVTNHPSPRNQHGHDKQSEPLVLTAGRLAVQLGYRKKVPAGVLKMIEARLDQGLRLSAIRLVAQQVRSVAQDLVAKHPNLPCHMPAAMLSTVLNDFGFPASVQSGTFKVDKNWPRGSRGLQATKTPIHFWTVTEGWLMDISQDRFAEVLNPPLPAASGVYCSDKAQRYVADASTHVPPMTAKESRVVREAADMAVTQTKVRFRLLGLC